MANLFPGKRIFQYSVGAQVKGEHIFNQTSMAVLKIGGEYICPKTETISFGTCCTSKKITKTAYKYLL